MRRLSRLLIAGILPLAASCANPSPTAGMDPFFVDADGFRQHYEKFHVSFDMLSQLLDHYAPLGDNDLCTTTLCKEQMETGYDASKQKKLLQIQKDSYPRLISSLGFSERVFLYTTNEGEVVTMPYSFQTEKFDLNVTLHYNGDEPLPYEECRTAPKKEKVGECALTLSDRWFLKYAWFPKVLFEPPAGTADAECQSKSRESFAAYTNCLQNSKAPRAEPKCDFNKLSPEEQRKCVDDRIAEARGR